MVGDGDDCCGTEAYFQDTHVCCDGWNGGDDFVGEWSRLFDKRIKNDQINVIKYFNLFIFQSLFSPDSESFPNDSNSPES